MLCYAIRFGRDPDENIKVFLHQTLECWNLSPPPDSNADICNLCSPKGSPPEVHLVQALLDMYLPLPSERTPSLVAIMRTVLG